MSQNTRRQIAYWVMLLLGLGLMLLQFRKYYYNSLELTLEEFIVTMVAVVLCINPLFFLEEMRKYFKNRNGKNNDKPKI